MPDGFTPVFKPAGVGSRAGAVPDPGPTTPANYVLRADATWGAPILDGSQFGIESMTIATGAAAATAAVVFDPLYAVAPEVLCSASSPHMIASADGITLGGFVATIEVATATIASEGATFTYLAL